MWSPVDGFVSSLTGLIFAGAVVLNGLRSLQIDPRICEVFAGTFNLGHMQTGSDRVEEVHNMSRLCSPIQVMSG